MTNQQLLEGDWNDIKSKLRQRWAQLTDDDLPQIRGQADQIVDAIHRKTGEAREAIERYVQEVFDSAASAIGMASGTVRGYARHASETVRHTGKQGADQVRAGYIEAERFVRDRPGLSLLVCLGVGFLVGAVISISLRSR